MKLLRHLEMIRPDGSHGRGVIHIEMDRETLKMFLDIKDLQHSHSMMVEFPSVNVVITVPGEIPTVPPDQAPPQGDAV